MQYYINSISHDFYATQNLINQSKTNLCEARTFVMTDSGVASTIILLTSYSHFFNFVTWNTIFNEHQPNTDRLHSKFSAWAHTTCRSAWASTTMTLQFAVLWSSWSYSIFLKHYNYITRLCPCIGFPQMINVTNNVKDPSIQNFMYLAGYMSSQN